MGILVVPFSPLYSNISLLSFLRFLRDSHFSGPKIVSHAPSFKNIISSHKPCRTMFDLFQFCLEAKSVWVPNLASIFQDRPHQSFLSCFFHIWGTRIQISPQESKSSVSFCTNIGNMSIPFHIICDSYTQVFYAFNVFLYSAFKGVVSLYLTRPFICQLHHDAFDGLKSHSPFPSPTAQTINVSLKFQCILFILDFTIANTIISKESYFRLKVLFQTQCLQRCHIYTRKTARGQERCPEGNPTRLEPNPI